ncbi:hypothetical protein C1H46_031959 [Malus baccata]|uniref:Disease resistance N-terminal domain-containing protein n=1 Tax=Malus baccata TaxID=106549 RepID=A0A540L7P3_MALBA|nr:hypothetical protein C1H46_031959 [Malus baccata]
MAESVVTFLLNRLTSLIEQEERLFSGVRAQIEDIIDELERIKAFLRVADTEEDEEPQLKVWVKQVRDLAYEIEDALEKFRLSHSHVHRHGFHAVPSSSWVRMLMTREWLKMKAEEKNLETDPPAPPAAGCCIISRIEKMGSSQFLNAAERCRLSSNSSSPILYRVRLIGYIK